MSDTPKPSWRDRLGARLKTATQVDPADAEEAARRTAEREAAKAQAAAARIAERRTVEAARIEERTAAHARRAEQRELRNVARSRWAQRALAIPTVVWMESVLWFCTVAALGVAYALSYSHQSGVFEQLDYRGWEHLVVPFALDLPLTASIAGLYLSARWRSPWHRRWTYRAMTVLTAPLSLGANALHGSVAGGHVDWSRVIEPVHLVSSLIPAMIVMVCAFGAEVTISEHARLDALADDRPEPGEPTTEPRADREPVEHMPVGAAHEPPTTTPESPGPAPEAPSERPTAPAHPRKTRAAHGTQAGRPKRGPRAVPVGGPEEQPTAAQVAAHIRAQLVAGRPLKNITKASVGRDLGLARSTAQRRYDDALALLRAEPDGPLTLNVGPVQTENA
jgi:hypothetical protein